MSEIVINIDALDALRLLGILKKSGTPVKGFGLNRNMIVPAAIKVLKTKAELMGHTVEFVNFKNTVNRDKLLSIDGQDYQNNHASFRLLEGLFFSAAAGEAQSPARQPTLLSMIAKVKDVAARLNRACSGEELDSAEIAEVVLRTKASVERFKDIMEGVQEGVQEGLECSVAELSLGRDEARMYAADAARSVRGAFSMVASARSVAAELGNMLDLDELSRQEILNAATQIKETVERYMEVISGLQEGFGLSAGEGAVTREDARELAENILHAVDVGKETVCSVGQAVSTGRQIVDDARDSCHRCLETPAGRVGAVVGGAAVMTVGTSVVWGLAKYTIESLGPVGMLVVGGVSLAASCGVVEKVREFLAPAGDSERVDAAAEVEEVAACDNDDDSDAGAESPTPRSP